MGIIFSRFRRKKQTTYQILESLDNKIKDIEHFMLDTEQRQKTIIGHLIIYSVGIYVLAAIFFYFYNFPNNLQGKILCITPLLVFPIIVVLIKRLFTWYFNRKIRRNQEKLSEMQDEKKQMLENVKDKETYKVAKEILEKFAPDQLRKAVSAVTPSASKELVSSPSNQLVNSTSGDVRKRPNAPPPGLQRPHIKGPGSSAASISPPNQTQYPVPRGPPMARPVLPRERGYLDKLVEYIVGDGPSNRYALICRQCQSHNGMALKEEFEYLAFRCCYCYQWNPARKLRPMAPRLQSSPGEQDTVKTSDSELESNTDTTDDSGDEDLLPKEPQLSEENAMLNGVSTEEMSPAPSESGADSSEVITKIVEVAGSSTAPDVSVLSPEPSELPSTEQLQDVNYATAKEVSSESEGSLNLPAKKSSSNLCLSDL